MLVVSALVWGFSCWVLLWVVGLLFVMLACCFLVGLYLVVADCLDWLCILCDFVGFLVSVYDSLTVCVLITACDYLLL